VPLEGPNSIILSNKTGNIFFTDSGPFGENVAPNGKGSVFVIDMQQQSIRPLALRCLQGPSGLAFANDEKVIFVA
jgi:sugar lactone lactonase YvrE